MTRRSRATSMNSSPRDDSRRDSFNGGFFIRKFCVNVWLDGPWYGCRPEISRTRISTWRWHGRGLLLLCARSTGAVLVRGRSARTYYIDWESRARANFRGVSWCRALRKRGAGNRQRRAQLVANRPVSFRCAAPSRVEDTLGRCWGDGTDSGLQCTRRCMW
jgi:hypothetical protein